ncbi:MAG TPA: hypothetical protein VF015_05730 [Acidimicrobiales bacterium]|jgi:hypothetical protein
MTAAARHRWSRRGDRGAGALDISVMGVCFFVPVVLLLVFAGRMNAGHAATESAARHAARTISIARDPTLGAVTAEDDAATIVREGSPMCLDMTFDHVIDDAEVSVTVACVVDLSELVLLPLPGTETVSATAVEVVDRHRETVAP